MKITLIIMFIFIAVLNVQSESAILLHFDPVTKVSGNFQTRVRGAVDDVVVVEISTNMTNWSPFQTNRIGIEGILLNVINNQQQNFLRARILLNEFGSIPNRMVWINSGTFMMGSPVDEINRELDEGPQVQVTIRSGFWMNKYETTQEEYLSLMGNNPSSFTGQLKYPVETVTWHDATNYCGKLTMRERAAGCLPEGYAYRLPTEAEWEYACRAGTTTATAFGNCLSSTQANFDGGYPYGGAETGPYIGTTAQVGSYASNAWGLFDMHGNVFEWCLDWYGAYPIGSAVDPRGAISGTRKVIRGGSWFQEGSYSRSAYRDYFLPDSWSINIGFRPVLTATP